MLLVATRLLEMEPESFSPVIRESSEPHKGRPAEVQAPGPGLQVSRARTQEVESGATMDAQRLLQTRLEAGPSQG